MLFRKTLAAMLLFVAAPAYANGLMTEMEAAIARGEFENITSVIVQKKGEIVFERYFGPGGPEYLTNTRSATKTLTSLALGAALEQAAFESVDDQVMPFFNAYAPVENMTPDKADIRLKDLLTMSSAFDCNDNDSTTPGYEDHMHEREDWTRFVLDLPTMLGWQRDATGLGPFRYCTAGTFLLGQTIEMAVGRGLDEFVASSIFTPLGITKYQWYRSPIGEEQAGGGLLLRARDLLKLGQLAQNRGMWNGRRLLPEGWVAESIKPHRKATADQDYGYQWWLKDFISATTGLAHPAYFMAGNGGNKVAVFDDLDMVVVITAEHYNRRGMHKQSRDLLQNYILPSFEAGVIQQ